MGRVLGSILVTASLLSANADPTAAQREAMVATQIAAQGVTDPAVLGAMRSVPRHLFVPEHLRKSAYWDGPLPIGHGQTISQPYVVAYMTELLQLGPGAKVLEIGTGSGYQAAILSCLSKEVYTIEIIEELYRTANKRLADLGYGNVHCRLGDGHEGWEVHAPFDAIVVTAAAEYIPPALIRQLKEGGRMVIPVGSPFVVQTLMLVEKRPGGMVRTQGLLPVRFVPLTRRR